jgi:hypothetical protein
MKLKELLGKKRIRTWYTAGFILKKEVPKLADKIELVKKVYKERTKIS